MELAGKRILVVDDDAAIADFLCDAFSSVGASLKVASSVKDGLDAIRAGEFDLILLDYVISEKVAEQFLAKAAILGTGASVPVIIVCGHGENLTMELHRQSHLIDSRALSSWYSHGVQAQFITCAAYSWILREWRWKEDSLLLTMPEGGTLSKIRSVSAGRAAGGIPRSRLPLRSRR